MSRMRFSTRLYLLVAFGVMATLGTTGALVLRMRAVAAAYDAMLSGEVAQQDLARQMQVTFKTQVQEWKNVLLRGRDPESRNKYAAAFAQAEAVVREQAQALVQISVDAEARQLAHSFLSAHDDMRAKYAVALEAFQAGEGHDPTAADQLVKGQDRAPTDLVDRIVARLGSLVNEKRQRQHAQLAAEVRAALLAAGIVAAMLFIASFFQSRRLSQLLVTVARELQTNASHVQAAAEHVSAAAHTLSSGSSAQAESMQRTSGCVGSVRRAMEDNGRQAERMIELVHGADAVVIDSRRSLDEMVRAMGAVSESSQGVARIIKTIDEIVFQTNLLALNAAVEAARAGEAGLGFAVVADEVRSLAQRAAAAARDTTTLIEQSMARVRDSQQRVQDVEGSMRTIADRVGDVRVVAGHVGGATRDQATEITALAEALDRMGQVTHTTAATAEESAAASEELTAQAAKTRDLAGALLAILGMHRNDSTRARPTRIGPEPPMVYTKAA